jgi:hypothetical protein
MMSMTYDPNELYRILPFEMQRQVPFIISLGINNALFGARTKQVGDSSYSGGEMDMYVKGGATKWTKQGMKVRQATKGNLSGKLVFEDNRDYMAPLIYGGEVKPKKRKLLQPSKQLLSDGQIGAVKMSNFGGIMPSRKAVAKNKIKKSYFVGTLRGDRKSKEGNKYRATDYGLWRRYMDGKTPRLQLVLSMARSSRKQKVVYPVDRLVKDYVEKTMKDHMDAAVKKAIATSR